MHRDLPGSILIRVGSLEALAHHLEGLPKQQHKHGAVDQGKQAVQHGEESRRAVRG